MNRLLRRSIIALASVALACLPCSLAAGADAGPAASRPATGTISGHVKNQATSAYLEGAQVVLLPSGRSTFTGRDGGFTLPEIPAGTHTLSVTYTGLDAQTKAVSVIPGRTVTQDVALSSGIYRLEKVVVAGEREGNALALTHQRNALNVKNVIATDALGNIPSGNVGDFLQRLPGITAEYVGSDVRQVQIRGINPDLNSVTIDGVRIASAQSANFGRAFEFEQASLGAFETIEVTKAPTPDMEADAIGGSVNLVSKTAFDRAAPNYLNYTLGLTHRPEYRGVKPNNELAPSTNVSLSRVFGRDKNWGLFLTNTYHLQYQNDTAALYDYENTLGTPAYAWRVSVPRPAGVLRERWATGANLDYKFSDRTVFSLNTQYNYFYEDGDTRTFQPTTSQAVAQINPATGAFIGTGTILPGYTEYFTEARQHTNTFVSLSQGTVDKTGATFILQPRARHRFSHTDIDYGLTWSRSATYYETGSEGRRHAPKHGGVKASSVTTTLRNVGWKLDRTGDKYWGTLTQTAGPDMYDLNNYSGLTAVGITRTGVDKIAGGQFNLKHNVRHAAVPLTLKAGASYRRQTRETWANSLRHTYLGPDGVFGNADDQLGQFRYTGDWHTGNNRGSRPPPWLDTRGIARHIEANRGLWLEDLAYRETERLNSRREIEEQVLAGYVMGSLRFRSLSLLTGLRMEETRDEAEGPLQYISPAERARRAAWVGTVTPAESVRRIREEWSGRSRNEGDYRSYFPGLHLKYEARPGLVGRLSYSTGIGRPSFAFLIPLDFANDINQTVTASNTSLRPQYSDNFDLSLEYYFEPVGVISVGVFHKRITDFIFQDNSQIIAPGANNGFNGEYAGYRLITQANGGSATVRGAEFNYQQQLSFLPGSWRGFSVRANYTVLETEGNYGTNTQSSTNQIAGFLPRTANVGVSYAGHGWDLRVDGNWRDTYLQTFSTVAANVTWYNPRLAFSTKAKYTFSEKLAVFLDVDNLFAEPLYSTYRVNENRVTQYRLTAPKVVAGIQGRF